LDVYFWEDKKVSVVQSCFSGFPSTRYIKDTDWMKMLPHPEAE